MTQALPSILQKIIQDKTTWIAEKQAQLPLASFQDQLERSDRDFIKRCNKAQTTPFIS